MGVTQDFRSWLPGQHRLYNQLRPLVPFHPSIPRHEREPVTSPVGDVTCLVPGAGVREFVPNFEAFGAGRGYMATPGSTTRLRALSAPTMAILGVAWQETFHGIDVLESIVGYTSRNAAPG